MKTSNPIQHANNCFVLFVLIASLLGAPSASAQSENTIIFKPPAGGTPGGRIGAGTRNFKFGPQPLTLIAPKGGGLTGTENPVLAWNLSEGFAGHILLSIRGSGGEKPLLVRKYEGEFTTGLYGIDLGNAGIDIPAGTVFIWEVALTPAGERSPTERLISFIERAENGRDLVAGTQDSIAIARGFANVGLWYDALSALLILEADGRASTQYPAQFISLLGSAGIQYEHQ